MLIFQGLPAFSEFRNKKILESIQKIDPLITNVFTEYIHFVKVDKELTRAEHQILSSLLSYGYQSNLVNNKGSMYLVTPRPGTISAWSTKATDIARNAGLLSVRRIERGIAYHLYGGVSQEINKSLYTIIADRMTEKVFLEISNAEILFKEHNESAMNNIPILADGVAALKKANLSLGLALANDEINYLVANFKKLNRDPTDVELMMFAQANSEHCRHKIFNSRWTIDGKKRDKSLFEMIKNTYKQSKQGVLSAYDDNAAVIEGSIAGRFYPDPKTKIYSTKNEPVNILIKVETHNHPTAISPFSGAGTGSGGEIRDEGSVGRGSKPKAGLTGFTVSNLHIPNFLQPWEQMYGKPNRIASPLKIMIDGPLGGAAFNNEFGRPNICGYFRTFETDYLGERRGYHKPIMIAGGYGNIRTKDIKQFAFKPGCKLIVIGGSAMLIGLGGGAASSMETGSSDEELDFASVQRQNPEMERRCQEVIDQCWQLDDQNPIAFIHDVGAGGLSNAFPELVKDGGCGGKFELRDIPSDDASMSPLAIWCNEAQERYVMAVDPLNLSIFEEICEREKCPYSIVGESLEKKQIILSDKKYNLNPIDLPMSILFGKPPKIHKNVQTKKHIPKPFDSSKITITKAINRVLKHPAVASKSFLITISDRSVTGMVARDQMVGPWQVPVADCGVTTTSYDTFVGEAMAMGERPPLALLDAAASARMAVGEAITNIVGCDIKNISDIKLSANWMSASGHEGEDEKLYSAVEALGLDFCPKLGIAIPVGKDSMSMKTSWKEANDKKSVISPLSLIITAFSPVNDVRRTLTPQIIIDVENTSLLYVDLGQHKNRMGGSILAQTYNSIGENPPDIDDAILLKNFFTVIQDLNREDLLLSYHDRSDGGLFTTLVEMAFAGNTGIDITLGESENSAIEILFNEELGAVIQVPNQEIFYITSCFAKINIPVTEIGKLNVSKQIKINHKTEIIYSEDLFKLKRDWSETSFQIQARRGNANCAKQEYEALLSYNPGLQTKISFDINENIAAPYIYLNIKPRVAILRTEGVNGHIEMAAAFDRAEFDSVDVHMSDLVSGRVDLNTFKGLVACGGFSYGDVLGAGEGWAKSILFNAQLRDKFQNFFHQKDVFSLGICNGCQMLANLKSLIPGAEHWPKFVRNNSEEFEARFSLVKVEKSPSIFLMDMEGSVIPVAVSHGEGRVKFYDDSQFNQISSSDGISLRFVDHSMKITEKYPFNPNGSKSGVTGVTSLDGRANIMMPHPERVFRSITNSWHPKEWREDGPWLKMFRNARCYIN